VGVYDSTKKKEKKTSASIASTSERKRNETLDLDDQREKANGRRKRRQLHSAVIKSNKSRGGRGGGQRAFVAGVIKEREGKRTSPERKISACSWRISRIWERKKEKGGGRLPSSFITKSAKRPRSSRAARKELTSSSCRCTGESLRLEMFSLEGGTVAERAGRGGMRSLIVYGEDDGTASSHTERRMIEGGKRRQLGRRPSAG